MDSLINQKAIIKVIQTASERLKNLLNSQKQKQFIVSLFFLKCLGDRWEQRYDTLTHSLDDQELIDDIMRNERFQVPENAQFSYLYEHRNDPGNGKRLDDALSALEEANINKLTNLFQNIQFDSSELGDETQKNALLGLLIEDIHSIKLNLYSKDDSNINLQGKVFETIIEYLSTNISKSDIQFYTPNSLSQLMAQLLKPEASDKIYDPCCGSASLLHSCAEQINEKHGSSSTYSLYGQDISQFSWSLAKMNLYLNNHENHNLVWGDSIRMPKHLSNESTLQKFDVIVSHPPISSQNWGFELASEDKFDRFSYGIPPKGKGDFAFILHMLSSLNNDSGRMAVVVPLGVLFRSGSEAEIRQKLIENNKLDAIIALPEKLFTETNIPSAILIFKANKLDSNVLFINASNEYKTESRNQKTLTNNSIDNIVNVYYNRESVDGYAYLASLKELNKNKFNWSVSLYVTPINETSEIDLLQISQEKIQLKSELINLDNKMNQLINELGFTTEQ